MLPPHYDITIILTKALVNNLSTQTVFVVVVCLFVFLATFFFHMFLVASVLLGQ